MSSIRKIKLYAATFSGTILEYYDYSLFIFLSPILATIFFPEDVISLAIIKTYGLGFIGTAARPLGGYFFGRIGDIFGRKIGLFYSIICMTISTTIMMFLPSYNNIGIISPIIFVFCRLIQSFSAGGELNGSATFVLEHTENSHKGIVSGLLAGITALGNILGSIASYICITSSNPEFNWRYAYALGIFLGVAGLIIRLLLSESPEYISKKNDRKKITVEIPKLLKSIIISGTFSSYFYFSFVVLNSYIPLVRDISQDLVSRDSTIILLIYSFFVVVSGYMSSRFKPELLMLIGVILTIFLGIPIMKMITKGPENFIFIYRIMLVMVTSIFMGSMHQYVCYSFPTHDRYTLSSISYSIGSLLLGSSTPIIAIFIWSYTGIHWVPVCWIIFTSLLSFFVLVNVKKFLYAIIYVFFGTVFIF